MKEIVKINLLNEMDLILANKRSMKLAELCGLSLTVQTAFATAVSEIGRCTLGRAKDSFIMLCILSVSPNKKQIAAVVCNMNEEWVTPEPIKFAKKLVGELTVLKSIGSPGSVDIHIKQDLKFNGLISEAKIQSFIRFFQTETPLSPYDEIRRQNIQLLEVSRKLRESENQYRQLAETLPIMMLSINAAGETIYTNQWLKDYFGNAENALPALKWEKLAHPEDYPSLEKQWNSIFQSKDSFQTQARLRHKLSHYHWHLISIVPVKNDKNVITQWTGFFADIHAQKVVEETLKDNVELKEAQSKLVEYQNRLVDKISELNISNHELEQFAFIASHDLQEPLRKIITFSNLLQERVLDLDSKSQLYFSKIVSSSARMSALINDVLNWSKVTKTTTVLSPIDLNVLVEDVKSDFEQIIKEKQAVVNISELGEIHGIPLQMIQLFTNLLSNSLKYCNKAPVINITGRMLDGKDLQVHKKFHLDRKYTEIIVSDNGIGFEQKYADQIFGIFQRLNGRSEYTGTGIGLAICKKIVENHGGLIFAASDVGKGAVFTVILPLNNN